MRIGYTSSPYLDRVSASVPRLAISAGTTAGSPGRPRDAWLGWRTRIFAGRNPPREIWMGRRGGVVNPVPAALKPIWSPAPCRCRSNSGIRAQVRSNSQIVARFFRPWSTQSSDPRTGWSGVSRPIRFCAVSPSYELEQDAEREDPCPADPCLRAGDPCL